MHSILLAEDDKTIRMTIEFALTKAGHSVTSVDNGETAVNDALRTPFDLILLDVMLPGKDGIQVTRALREAELTTPILMLTALDSERNKIDGLDAGADDYLTKPFSTGELLARIRAILRRSGIQEEEARQIIQTGPLSIDLDNARVLLNGTPVPLRAKEYLLLTTLATHPGKLCTRQWLAGEVWGEEFISSSRTIDTHVRRIRKALDGSGMSFIQTCHGMGYRFEMKREHDYR